MENLLFTLKSLIATLLSSSSTAWAIGTIFAFLCGTGLLLVFLPSLKSNPSLPQFRKRRNIRKRPVEPRGKGSRTRKKSGALKAYRDGRKGLDERRGPISLLQSSPQRLSSKAGFHRRLHRDPPGAECQTASMGAHQPCREPVEGPAVTTSPALSLAPLTEHPLTLASTLSAEPPEDRADLERIPPGPTAKNSAPGSSCLASPNPGLGWPSCRVSFLPRWNITKVLFFPTASSFENQQGPLCCHRPVASFWGGSTNTQGETGSPSIANPEAQKLLETLITETGEREVWEKEEQGDPGTGLMHNTHSVMSGLGLRWGLPLLTLEPGDLKLREADPSPLPPTTCPPSATPESGASQASGTSHAPQVRGMGDTLGSRDLQLLPEKRQPFPESRFGKRVRRFLPCLRPREDSEALEDPLPRGRPASATAQSRGPVRTRLIVEAGAVEAQARVTSLGRALGERLGLGRRLRGSKSAQRQERLPAWEGPSRSHGVPSSPDPTRLVMAESHQATPRDHNCPGKHEWSRDRDGKRTLPLGEPGSPARPCQHGAAAHHYPPCCVQRGDFCGQLECACQTFPHRKTFLPKRMKWIPRKPIFSR